jgi:hypothetical protein
MSTGTSLVDWTQMRLARFFATRLATPLILTGTMALAAGGAVATTPMPAHQNPAAAVRTIPAPLFPPMSCHTGWYGLAV